MRSNNLISLLLGSILTLSVSISVFAEPPPERRLITEAPITLPTKSLEMHPLAGVWWAQTIHDNQGQPIWEGGTTQEKVVLRVSHTGGIQTVIKCNILNGQFGRADVQSVALLQPGFMTSTRKMCLGQYPPTVTFTRVAAFERTDLQLRLFDSEGQPIATYLDVYGMVSEFESILN